MIKVQIDLKKLNVNLGKSLIKNTLNEQNEGQLCKIRTKLVPFNA